MDKYEVRDMSGSAFKNRNRRNDNDSNYSGTVKIEGKEYWINVWVKKDKNDQPWFSYSFRGKKAASEPSSSKQDQIIDDSDLPF